MDINDLENSRNATFAVKVGTNKEDGSDVGFVVVGKNSQQYQDADEQVRAFNIKANALRAQQKTSLDTATDEGAMQVAKVVQIHRKMYLDHCVVGWFGFTENGQPAPFSKEAAARVFQARPNWTLQVVAEIENEENFEKG